MDASWLENQGLRTKFRADWEYTTHLIPVVPGSKVFITHRIAVGPMAKQENSIDALQEENTFKQKSV